MQNFRLSVLVLIVLAAAMSRLLPHPWNMAPLTAIALFGGAYFSDKWLAFLVPLGALLLSDALLGFYRHMEIVYGSFALIVCIGFLLQKRKRILPIISAAFASSVLFFVTTNFGVWAFESLYPKTLAGLMTCYTMALPFFGNTLAGDLLYTALLFGGFALLERRFAILQERGAYAA